MSVDERIRRWVKPIITRLGNVEIRDVYAERNRPLILSIEGSQKGGKIEDERPEG